MRPRLHRKVLLVSLACLLVGLAVWCFRAPRPSDPKAAVATSESIRDRLSSAWEQRLSQLGSEASQAEIAEAAAAFSLAHADEIAQQEQLADAEHSAPYLGRVEAISNRAAAKVRSYDEVRRKLGSGELTELPPDLAPPPLPEPLAEPSAR